MSTIRHASIRDVHYPIGSGHGSDAIHKDRVNSYAVTLGKLIAAHVVARPHEELTMLLPR